LLVAASGAVAMEVYLDDQFLTAVMGLAEPAGIPKEGVAKMNTDEHR